MKAAADQDTASRPAGAPIEQIVSGGQTGVDRAALDVASELGIPSGGWCPKGRKAEDGPIPQQYRLEETTSRKYAERTELNVRDSDGTLILTVGTPIGGTALTRVCAERLGKPCRVVNLDHCADEPAASAAWLNVESIRKLNIAGPRESQRPGIYERAAAFLRELLAAAASQ